MQTSLHANGSNSEHDARAFDSLVAQAQNHFNNRTDEYRAKNATPVAFTTDVSGDELFQIYLNAFEDPAQRQIHNCNCCKQYFRNYGNLVFVNDSGDTEPAVWPTTASGIYEAPIAAVREAVRDAKVTGVFSYQEKTWSNTMGSGAAWTHYKVTPSYLPANRDRLKTPYQVMAEKKEDYKNLMVALSEFKAEHVKVALQLLEGNELYRSEKIIGGAQFLADLHKIKASKKGKRTANLLWKKIALAPAGFCHPRSGVIGTLLEDIAAGMSFDQVKRRFDDKMRGEVYQRPQALPSSGNVKRAEEIVEKLGVRQSLRRRFAALSEVRQHAIWERPQPKQKAQSGDSVFGHLKTKDQRQEVPPQMNVPKKDITWDKFVRVVLPKAQSIELLTKKHNDNYCALVTASDKDAPPILQWDLDEARNPASWYLYVGGSPASRWHLPSGFYVPVEAILPQPNMWSGENFKHQGEGALLVLRGAKDENGGSVALFPETLRKEFHEIRATIESFSRSTPLEQAPEEQLASGVKITSNGKDPDITVRVTTEIGTEIYRIDRWD
jgi:hypothetical protein